MLWPTHTNRILKNYKHLCSCCFWNDGIQWKLKSHDLTRRIPQTDVLPKSTEQSVLAIKRKRSRAMNQTVKINFRTTKRRGMTGLEGRQWAGGKYYILFPRKVTRKRARTRQTWVKSFVTWSRRYCPWVRPASTDWHFLLTTFAWTRRSTEVSLLEFQVTCNFT